MEFTVWIDSETEDPRGLVRKTLADVTTLIASGMKSCAIRDEGGNIIGRWSLTVEKEGQ